MLNSIYDQKQLGVIKINTFESMIVCIDKSCSSLLVPGNGVYHKVVFCCIYLIDFDYGEATYGEIRKDTPVFCGQHSYGVELQ